MRFGVGTVLTIAMLVVLMGHGVAGECVDGDEYYVGVIEGTIAVDIPPGNDERFAIEVKKRAIEYAIGCLGCGCPGTRTNRWAGPEAAACFKLCREKPLRPRLVAALAPRLEATVGVDSLSVERYSMARALASWGVRQAGTFDVFKFVVDEVAPEEYSLRRALRFLAAMDDPRTVLFLRSTYDSLRAGNLDKTRDDLVEILSCLYHLSDPGAVAFAAEIVKNESDPLLVERAKRVVNRP